MGSPPEPSPDQQAELERAGQLALLDSHGWLRVADRRLTLRCTLPRQGVSLLRLELRP
jgi:xylan 1,4-beta-xylosidase